VQLPRRPHRGDEHHDRLIEAFGHGGVVEIMELMREMDAGADDLRTDGQLRWEDLPEFFARHQWERPADVGRLAGWLATAIPARLERADVLRVAYLDLLVAR
jgi:hypothetical protein